ncbi:MAG: beta-lactamase family protein [Proteobacteria bacterium]|nr:beta-lactamase family protein [Pseudomonadota bacterium]
MIQSQITQLIEYGIQHKLYSAAQIVVSNSSQILFSYATGQTHTLNKKQHCFCTTPEKISTHSLFDIASITKPLATAALMMCAIDDELLHIDQKLVSLQNLSVPPWLLGNTIGDLLSHQTELPAWEDWHGELPRLEEHEHACEYFERQIQRLSPRDDGKSWCYSDFGYILLGILLERTYQKPLDELFRLKIAKPLGLDKKIMYRPLHHVPQKSIVATAMYKNMPLQGHPDDANTRALTHMAGHAGLFASAETIATYLSALLNGHFPCKPKTIETFLNYRSTQTPFALGWDRPTSSDSLSGRTPQDNVIGHLGFTGCSAWIDLDKQSHVVFLTNRTHVNNEPKSLGETRRAVHKLAWSMI